MLREGLYVDEGEETTGAKLPEMLALVAQEKHAEAARLCKEIYLGNSTAFIRVPIALDKSAVDKLRNLLPTGQKNAGDDRAFSPKSQRFLREPRVIRYVGVRWLCRQLLMKHRGLRDAFTLLVGDQATKEREAALLSGTNSALLAFVQRFGPTDAGCEVSFLLARRYMEAGEIQRALALFKALGDREEVAEFSRACKKLAGLRSLADSRRCSAPLRGAVCGSTEAWPALYADWETEIAKRLQQKLPEGITLPGRLCKASAPVIAGQSRVGAVLAAENDLVHCLVCLTSEADSGMGILPMTVHGRDARATSSLTRDAVSSEEPSVSGNKRARVAWLVPLCWQRLQSPDGLPPAESASHETQRSIGVLSAAVTSPTITDDGLVVVQTGHGIVAAVDLVFGYPVWLVSYAVETSPTEKEEGKTSSSSFIQRYHWPRSWAPAAPVTSCSAGFQPADAGVDRSVVVATPVDTSTAHVLRANDGFPIAAIESWRNNEFEFNWAVADESGFVFLVGKSILAMNFTADSGKGGANGLAGGAVSELAPTLETFPLPEGAIGCGLALAGTLAIPTTRGLYEVDFNLPRPAMKCLAEWNLPEEGVTLGLRPRGGNSVLVSIDGPNSQEKIEVKRR